MEPIPQPDPGCIGLRGDSGGSAAGWETGTASRARTADWKTADTANGMQGARRGLCSHSNTGSRRLPPSWGVTQPSDAALPQTRPTVSRRQRTTAERSPRLPARSWRHQGPRWRRLPTEIVAGGRKLSALASGSASLLSFVPSWVFFLFSFSFKVCPSPSLVLSSLILRTFIIT